MLRKPDQTIYPAGTPHPARNSTSQGELKVFLGYAAGVGKTYAMLEAAQQRQLEGVDVVIAFIKGRDWSETQSLAREFETLPRVNLLVRDEVFSEMDLDAVLQRAPALALVDELAHRNGPGLRHPQRYQDVEELLAAGIDVYTTLNIQQVESLNDVVAQVTGVLVAETVPDRVLDQAAEIELIDLPPVELMQRLEEAEGDLRPNRNHDAAKFFRRGNLTALRELAMRRAAEHVDEQMRHYMQSEAIAGPWPVGERLLVCVSPSPLSERLVRSAKRLATRLDAEWYAIYVETPQHRKLSEQARDRVARTLRLAEELGGTAIILPGRKIADVVAAYARDQNITKIVAGKPVRSRVAELFRGSLVDQIVRQSRAVDVYVISNADDGSAREDTHTGERQPWLGYLQSIILVLAVSLLGQPLRSVVIPTNLVMFYLLVVVIAALRLGRRPAILAALLSVLIFNFFFIPPRLTFVVSDFQHLITFAGLMGVGLLISTLVAEAREQAEAAQRRETQTAALYALNKDLAVAGNLSAILDAVLDHISRTFKRPAAIFLPDENSLQARAASPGFPLNETEQTAANWAYTHHQPAGQGTDTLADRSAQYTPLQTALGTVGVLGIGAMPGETTLTREQQRLLEVVASQTALSIERSRLADAAQQAELSKETERLQTALLNSISHDLRTPLATITGALSSLLEDEAALNRETRRSLVETASEEAERLNRLVGNLLDMSRMEAGALRVAVQPCDIQDLIGVSLAQVGPRLGQHPVRVEAPDNLPLIPVDFILITQVLINLLDNALKYSPPEAPIQIRAHVAAPYLQLEVADRGIGVPPDLLPHLFEKFYRVPREDGVTGTGLGLSICHGIVEAHGGQIEAQLREGGGLRVVVSLPLQPPTRPLTRES